MTAYNKWEIDTFTGVDNYHHPHDPVFQGGKTRYESVPAALLSATNVDIDDSGKITRRSPLELTTALPDTLGGWELDGRVFLQDDTTLYELAAGELIPLVSDLSGRISLCAHAGLVFGTDGANHFELDGTTARTWGLSVPQITLNTTSGTLAAGRYVVQASFTDVRGNEGGTSNVSAIELSEDQAITVALTSVPSEAVSVNVYVGLENQEATSFQAQVAIGSFPYTINAHTTAADPPRTGQMTGPWSGITGVTGFRSVLLLWRDNVVVRSEAQEPHLFHADDIWQFPYDVRACEGMTSGAWVGTAGGLYWVAGESFESMIPIRKTTSAVASGSMQIQGEKLPSLKTTGLVALFCSEDGLVAGLPSGETVHLTDRRYVFSADSRVSMTYVERGYLSQLLIAVN